MSSSQVSLKTRNVFKTKQDLDLLDLVESKNPYFADNQTAVWNDVVDTLNTHKVFKNPIKKRAVVKRVEILVEAFRKDDLRAKSKSGQEEDYDRMKVLLTGITGAIDDSNRAKEEKKKVLAAQKEESVYASQVAPKERETGRLKRKLNGESSDDSTDDESEKQDHLHNVGGDDDDWESENAYRKTMKKKKVESPSTSNPKQSESTTRKARNSKQAELAASDALWAEMFAKQNDRKFAFKEAQAKELLEQKKEEHELKRQENENRKLELENQRLQLLYEAKKNFISLDLSSL